MKLMLESFALVACLISVAIIQTAGDSPQSRTCTLTVAGKCVNAVRSESGTLLDIYTCNESPGQNWILEVDQTIRLNDKCMEVEDSATGNLAAVQINNCNGSPAQQWIFLENGQLKNVNSNRCLDVKEATIEDGQPLIIFDCKSIDFENQTFEANCKPTPPIEPPPTPTSPKNPQPAGTCTLTVAGKCVNAVSSESGTLLDIYTCNESPGQKWIVEGDQIIRLNGKCMEVEDGATGNLSAVQLNDCNGSPAQEWEFLGSGQLKNINSNRCLDVKGERIEDGQPLIIFD